MSDLPRAVVGEYNQSSIIERLEAFFLENIGKVASRDQILKVARDPVTKKLPENWHQRLSELRTNKGYTILSSRDRNCLKVSEYLMESADRRTTAAKRVLPTTGTWKKVLRRAKNSCEWHEAGEKCRLKNGEIDPVGGGTVRLTPDHKTPHSIHPASDPNDPSAWQALCGRHQVIKKNFWDNTTGKLNVIAIVQAAPNSMKKEVYELLQKYFGETQ